MNCRLDPYKGDSLLVYRQVPIYLIEYRAFGFVPGRYLVCVSAGIPNILNISWFSSAFPGKV
jgi:hypothetical protein